MKAPRILIFYIILVLFNSCAKDEIETTNGYVQFDNEKSNLNYGYIEKIELNSAIQLRLYLSDRKINFSNGDLEFTESRDNLLVFILHNPNSSFEKISDYYPLSTDYENINIQDNIPFMVSSQLTINIKPSTDPNIGSEFEYHNFTWDNGSLTLDANGDKYEIYFSLKMSDQIIRGEYTGTVQDVSSN